MTKILLVEDDPFLLKMYQKKFQIEGFDVQTAPDGEEGLIKIKSFIPDLVLMDVMMPKLNGIDAVVKAKADPAIKNIPIVILTNLSATDDAQAAVKNGAAGYLIKSDYTPGQVVDYVKKVLNTHKSS